MNLRFDRWSTSWTSDSMTRLLDWVNVRSRFNNYAWKSCKSNVVNNHAFEDLYESHIHGYTNHYEMLKWFQNPNKDIEYTDWNLRKKMQLHVLVTAYDSLFVTWRLSVEICCSSTQTLTISLIFMHRCRQCQLLLCSSFNNQFNMCCEN